MIKKANNQLDILIGQLVSGNERALSKVLSLIESGATLDKQLEKNFKNHKIPNSQTVIGITGYPGAGKSTLINSLILELSKKNKKVAVLAVDPSSPITGGAVLGDRIRMQEVQLLEGVYLRSFASRGHLGGLTKGIDQAILAVKLAGFDYIILETIGVGQAEVEVSTLADLVLVVLVPGMGDSVQALKAGLLEIADIFVINKSDYPGAERLKKELLEMFSLSKENRELPIVCTVASKQTGVVELVDQIQHLSNSDQK